MKRDTCLQVLLVSCTLTVALLFAASCGGDDSKDEPDYDSSSLRISAELTASVNSGLFIQNAAGGAVRLGVSGWASYEGPTASVDYEVTNIFGEVVDQGSLTFAKGGAAQQVPINTAKLGHFTLIARINKVASIPGAGSRPRGFITWAVVMDPAARRQKAPYSDGGADVDKYLDFGMAFVTRNIDGFDMISLLGLDASYTGAMSWHSSVTGSGANTRTDTGRIEGNNGYALTQNIYNYIETTPYFPLAFRTERGGDGETTGLYGGELNELGEEELVKYVQSLAKVHIEKAPGRPHHYYQILWEPVDWWGAWSPSGDDGDAALVRFYEIAYGAIHEVYDQKAADTGVNAWRTRPVILGPTYSGASDRDGTLEWHERQFKKGLAEYIDGLSLHPYNDPGNSGDSNISRAAGLYYADTIKAVMDMTVEYYNKRADKYFDKPFFWGTELGMREDPRSIGPLGQAKYLTRQNIIMMGEGFDANYAFCFSDWSDSQRYGYFYNMTFGTDTVVEYAPPRVSPKPIVPAFTAMTHFLKGYASEGRVGGLDGSNSGYKFKDKESNDVVYVLWNYDRDGSAPCTFDTGGSYTVYDIVGNETDSGSGSVTLTLTEYVQYVKVK